MKNEESNLVSVVSVQCFGSAFSSDGTLTWLLIGGMQTLCEPFGRAFRCERLFVLTLAMIYSYMESVNTLGSRRRLVLGKTLLVCFAVGLTAGCEKKNPSLSSIPLKESNRPSTIVADTKQNRYAWNLQTLVAPYEIAGFANPAWDEPAKRALTAFAGLRSKLAELNTYSQIIVTNCDLAVQAGCKDPMIEYLHIRFPASPSATRTAYADALCQAALDMKPSRYPAIRKFYANRRAVEEFYNAYGSKADRHIIEQVGGTAYYLPEILSDPTIPPEEAYDACEEILQAYAGTKNLNEYETLYQTIEKPIFGKWPNDYWPWLIKGTAQAKLAWICRGSGYADTVSDEGWQGFKAHLQSAEQALARAWEINQNDVNIPLSMMRLELGQGQGRERMELWFNRAMAIDTNSYDACTSKLFYLEPKWHGSDEDMLDFGRQCVRSRDWGGRVPLILLDAHYAIQRRMEGNAKNDYWKQPQVWLDLQAAFDRFLTLNPDATNWYHDYALYAYRCGQWDKFNELLTKLGPINYDYFGGKAEFDKMVEWARQHSGKTQPIKK
jgi:hypothetical protein